MVLAIQPKYQFPGVISIPVEVVICTHELLLPTPVGLVVNRALLARLNVLPFKEYSPSETVMVFAVVPPYPNIRFTLLNEMLPGM